MSPLVTPAWLATKLGTSGVGILDATYYLPNENKNAVALYQSGHIPGAVFFDLDQISDTDSALPHMLPYPAKFAAMVGALGISSQSEIVVYDQRGLFSAARVWWMFRLFGHDNIKVLDGGLPRWQAEGHPITSETSHPAAQIFEAKFRPAMVRSIENMQANLTTKSELVIDARAAGRFNASEPEPRAGMRSGHIPGAKSLPFSELLDNGSMRPPAELRAKLTAVGADGSKPVVTSCGSGVTAAVLTLGLVVAGLPEGAIYDGSWSEWGSRADTPIEV